MNKDRDYVEFKPHDKTKPVVKEEITKEQIEWYDRQYKKKQKEIKIRIERKFKNKRA